jgi:hypothetical protein
MMPHDQSTSMERITLLVTLMLTATTYSLVVAESLPTLPYLTLIDKYVLGTFMYFGIIGFELAVIDWSPDLDWPAETDEGAQKRYGASGFVMELYARGIMSDPFLTWRESNLLIIQLDTPQHQQQV